MPLIVAKNRINMTDFNAVRNAAFALRVTEQQLRDAVSVVGNKIDDLTVHFQAYHARPFYKNSFGRWRM